MLGLLSAFCQSCGMILSSDQQRGSEKDGSPSAGYCAWCYKDGAFTAELSMDEMIDNNLKSLKEYNRERGQEFSFEGAKATLKEQLPQLKRWKEKHKDP